MCVRTYCTYRCAKNKPFVIIAHVLFRHFVNLVGRLKYGTFHKKTE